MEVEIGANAGKVWSKLSTDGPQPANVLAKSLSLRPAELDRALGWLAREGKIQEVKDPKGLPKISLR